jgi:hypothetical protein
VRKPSCLWAAPVRLGFRPIISFRLVVKVPGSCFNVGRSRCWSSGRDGDAGRVALPGAGFRSSLAGASEFEWLRHGSFYPKGRRGSFQPKGRGGRLGGERPGYRAGGGFPDGAALHPLGGPVLHDGDVAVTSAGARERAHQVGADCLSWLPVRCRVHFPRRWLLRRLVPLTRRAVPDVLGGLTGHAGPVVPEH